MGIAIFLRGKNRDLVLLRKNGIAIFTPKGNQQFFLNADSLPTIDCVKKMHWASANRDAQTQEQLENKQTQTPIMTL